MRAVVRGPELAVRTCARRLAPLGIEPVPPAGGPWRVGERDVVEWVFDAPGGDGGELEVDLSWYGGAGPADEGAGSEAVVQAVSGLMQVHGRDAGRPQRLGLEVASVAAGVLAGQAVAAADIGRRRGAAAVRVESSVLGAALLLVSHRVAEATTGEAWFPTPPGPAPGPPFRSADGVWFELETLDPEAWKAFWHRLGAGATDLGRAWTLFRSRYFRGTASLPPGLHEAIARHRLADLTEAAGACGVSLCPVRSYAEVLDDLGCWAGHPVVTAAAAADRPGAAREAGASGPGGGLPLAGLRVVEATSRLQGPLAGLLLQMLGAEVVRVEPPGGDPARAVPPLVEETGTFFLTFNRGKQAVELDLGAAGGRSDLRALLAEADAFVHNWRPGRAEEWGLDAARLRGTHPHLVHVEASGWGGRAAPGLVGTDYLVQARSGVAAGITPAGRPAMASRALLTDYFGALVTAEGLLAGLHRRERTGHGCHVGTSLLAGAMALQAHVLEALVAGREHGRRAGRAVWGPLDHPLPAADRLVAVSVDGEDAYRRLCRACDVEPAAPSPATDRLVVDGIAGRPASEWEQVLRELGIPCAAVCTDLAALPADPRLAPLFESLAGRCRAPRAPWRLGPRPGVSPPAAGVAAGASRA